MEMALTYEDFVQLNRSHFSLTQLRKADVLRKVTEMISLKKMANLLRHITTPGFKLLSVMAESTLVPQTEVWQRGERQIRA